MAIKNPINRAENGKVIPYVKSKFPFRMGCTSYVIPADIVQNVLVLAPLVDDIELVLYESPITDPLPTPKDMQILLEQGQEHDVSYTIHLPIRHRVLNVDKEEFDRFVADVEMVLERFGILNPYSWIVHCDWNESVPKWQQTHESWLDGACALMDKMRKAGFPCDKIAVENLNDPLAWYYELAHRYGTGLCLDLGHLWKGKEQVAWPEIVPAVIDKVLAIHLHGVAGGADHRSLDVCSNGLLQQMVGILKITGYRNVVTVETFRENDTRSSLERMKLVWGV